MATETVPTVGIGTETVTERLGPGVLINLSVHTETLDLGAADTWITISLCRGGSLASNRHVHILSDYIQSLSPISWNGLIEVMDDDLLRMTLSGQLNAAIRITHQIINPLAEGPVVGLLKYANTPK